MYEVKQSTSLEVVFFAHDSAGDGVTGKVDGDFTKRIKKAGGSFGAMTVTISELENGWYGMTLSSSHTDTLGVLAVSLSASGIKRVNLMWRVTARITDDLSTQASVDVVDDFLDTEIAAIKAKTDSLTFSTANRVDAQVFGMEAGTVTATAVATGAIDADAIADNAIDAGAIASDAITAAKIATGAITAAKFAAGAIDAAAIADAAIDAATFASGAITATAIAADAITAAKIADSAIDGNTFATNTGLRPIRSDTAQTGAAATITLDLSADANDDFYNDTIISIVSGQGAGQARLIYDYAQSSKVAFITPNWVVTPDNTSVFVIQPRGRIGVGTWVGGVPTGLVGSRVPADVGSISTDATAADTLEALLDGGGGTLTANITGNITGNLSGSVGSVTGAVGSVTGAVGSVTGAVGSVTGNVGGNVTGSVGSVTGNVGGNVTGSVGSLATQAKADVNAEVVDALATDTYAEPGQGAPAATTTISAKINYLYKAWRNKKTQTSSQYSLFADDASTVDQKAAVSDDATTTTVGEVTGGP